MTDNDNLTYTCRLCKEEVPEFFFKFLEQASTFGFTRDKWDWAINYMQERETMSQLLQGYAYW